MRIHVVAAALVDSLAQPRVVLAARRTKPVHLRGRWELPGGKVKPGETSTQALHRELAEELGVRVRLGEQVSGPLDHGRWQLAPPYEMSVWFAEVVQGDPAPLQDHDALVRLCSGSIHEVAWLDSNAAIVAAVQRRLHASQ